MVVSLVAVLAASVGQVGSVEPFSQYDRPVATIAPYPVGMADDVRRPGFNGRLWVSRPVMGAIQQGPYPLGWDSPGPEAYGAFDNQSAQVPARIGHLVVGISPWEQIEEQGLKRYEAARNFWLEEQGYTGGVRTFVNDAHLWVTDAEKAAAEDGRVRRHVEGDVEPTGAIVPRATITLPEDMPRQRRRLRVDAGGSAGWAMAPALRGGARVSWPMSAPAEVVARSANEPEAVRVITRAR